MDPHGLPLTMQHVILADGPDGCAKSTIAKELSQRLDIPYFKNSRQKMFFERDPNYFRKAMKYGDPFFCDYLKQTGASVILDRGHGSEWVYSQALGRETDMEMLGVVDGMFAGVGLKILSPFRSTYAGVHDQFDVLDEQRLNTIHELYAQFCRWTKCDVLRFCVDDEDIERQMQLIMPFVLGQDVTDDNDDDRLLNVIRQSDGSYPRELELQPPHGMDARGVCQTIARLIDVGRVVVGHDLKLRVDEQ